MGTGLFMAACRAICLVGAEGALVFGGAEEWWEAGRGGGTGAGRRGSDVAEELPGHRRSPLQLKLEDLLRDGAKLHHGVHGQCRGAAGRADEVGAHVRGESTCSPHVWFW